MVEELKSFLEKAKNEIQAVHSQEQLDNLRVVFLGRKAFLATVSEKMPDLPREEKPIVGKLLNQIKQELEAVFREKAAQLSKTEDTLDISFPGQNIHAARMHPLTLVIHQICRVFEELGFEVQEGPEVETEWYNFQALNIPLEHPSRDVFDTFYLDAPADAKGYKYLLRSHTSPTQIRMMQERKPPLAVVVPGKVYRPDNSDASHSFMFHQVEGFAVSEEICFSDLKGVLWSFAERFFSREVRLRFRPHYFPFTEPSAEVDVSCIFCAQKGCSVCKQSGWLEILGCGMIHPNVLKAARINAKKMKGFAFGMGVERIAMLTYQINDIRLFCQNHRKFLEQFYETER